MNNEQDILRRAQQGDSEAFRLLVEAYQTQVYRLALRMCGEAAAGEEWDGPPALPGPVETATGCRNSPGRSWPCPRR